MLRPTDQIASTVHSEGNSTFKFLENTFGYGISFSYVFILNSIQKNLVNEYP